MGLSSFMPHGMCFLWDPRLLGVHVVADALIAVAYFSIPVFLIWVLRKRGDLPFSWLLGMFALFIVSCGMTHIMSIWVIWHPDYWAEGAVKWVTAVASVGTALMLIPLTPRILSIRSPEQAQSLLDRLSREGTVETLNHLQRLIRYGVNCRSFTEQYLDGTGIFKEAVIGILAGRLADTSLAKNTGHIMC